MSNYEYETVDAETYQATTVITYTEGAELRRYTISADDLTDFIIDMEAPDHGERLVDIAPADD